MHCSKASILDLTKEHLFGEILAYDNFFEYSIKTPVQDWYIKRNTAFTESRTLGTTAEGSSNFSPRQIKDRLLPYEAVCPRRKLALNNDLYKVLHRFSCHHAQGVINMTSKLISTTVRKACTYKSLRETELSIWKSHFLLAANGSSKEQNVCYTVLRTGSFRFERETFALNANTRMTTNDATYAVVACHLS